MFLLKDYNRRLLTTRLPNQWTVWYWTSREPKLMRFSCLSPKRLLTMLWVCDVTNFILQRQWGWALWLHSKYYLLFGIKILGDLRVPIELITHAVMVYRSTDPEPFLPLIDALYCQSQGRTLLNSTESWFIKISREPWCFLWWSFLGDFWMMCDMSEILMFVCNLVVSLVRFWCLFVTWL